MSARAANAAFTAFKILIYFPRMDESSLPNGRGVADDDVEAFLVRNGTQEENAIVIDYSPGH